MTPTLNSQDLPLTHQDDENELALTPAGIEEYQREDAFASDEQSTPDQYPRMSNLSVGFLKRAIVRPVSPEPPEYVTISLPPRVRGDETALKKSLAVAEWNLLWEAGQFRRRFFDGDELTPDLEKIADRGDLNITFVPRTPARYYEYAPLFHLLNRSTAERFGLPLLKAGSWPYTMETYDIGQYLPADFAQRLSRAWAGTVWRHLNSGSPLDAFSKNDPIRLLAHNLDFWIPPVTEAIQQTLREFPVVEGDGDLPAEIQLIDGSFLQGATPAWPRMGGDLWRGEDDAADVVTATVEQADATGRLRGILDAVRSNRIEDDFSARWSHAREDFERKLYRKRNKISVKFVELPDSIPVQGPETEVENRMVFADFMTLLDEKERQVVVLLSSGYTKLTDIAAEMGYASHSPISKKLAKIRRQAKAFFDQ